MSTLINIYFVLKSTYLLRYGDIEFGSHFEKWPSPRYAQFLKFPPSRILKPYVYITQIKSQTSIPPKYLRAYRAGPGLGDRCRKLGPILPYMGGKGGNKGGKGERERRKGGVKRERGKKHGKKLPRRRLKVP